MSDSDQEVVPGRRQGCSV
ncbi:hypothetical protein AZE42_11157 [Rhizopogon vesiculosus]|uniref:Uncharacterized protein n=1 Tax=Rhizopogon vesiculosus TaxID=180088 RepID=A0A1J8PJQ6_9AGAM|nr:hypothetical protein AZE42_11157 [Rhizopogon vesiculosus]